MIDPDVVYINTDFSSNSIDLGTDFLAAVVLDKSLNEVILKQRARIEELEAQINASTASTTSVLGKARLNYMILGE